MSDMVYTVTAYRWGDREKHSYIVGVFSTKKKANKAAKFEKEYRGGKYECEILEVTVDADNKSDCEKIVSLPEFPTLFQTRQDYLDYLYEKQFK